MIGFVLVDKPRGPTSHDVVDVVRRALGVRRVGHGGTLDPPATGLLVLAVGPATRLLQYMQPLPKTYEFSCALGVRTTTGDAVGEVVARAEVSVSPAQVRAAAAAFVGEIDQVPPAVSAVKVGGERAYAKARRGEDVRLEPRRVTVHRLDVRRISADAFDAVVECSSGTYVRSLAVDIGERLGCGAHVVDLRRTAVGHLRVDDAVAPDAVDPAALRGVEDVLAHLPRVEVDADGARRAASGQRLPVDAPPGEVLVVGPEGAVGVFAPEAGALRALTVLGR